MSERLTSTDAARRFSEVLTAVEQDGTTFVVTRHGRPVAAIGPAAVASGRRLKALLREAKVDAAWRGELAALREGLELEDRSWSD